MTISMDGRGRCWDRILVEWPWCLLVSEAVHLPVLTDGFEADQIIGGWIGFRNNEDPVPAFGGQTPAEP